MEDDKGGATSASAVPPNTSDSIHPFYRLMMSHAHITEAVQEFKKQRPYEGTLMNLHELETINIKNVMLCKAGVT